MKSLYFFKFELETFIWKIGYAVFAYRNSPDEFFKNVRAVEIFYLLNTSFKALAGKNFTF